MRGIAVRDLRFGWPAVHGDPAFDLVVPAWTVAGGGQVALQGPSGCGKTTLLGLLSGELVAAGGSLVVDGEELVGALAGRRAAWRARHVGLVPQDAALVSWLDVVDNVLLPWRLHPALPRDPGAGDRARALLGALGLGDRLRHRPAQLSQGERQRVALARALVKRPRLLLADEPTSALDPARARDAVDRLRALASEVGATTVVVTHDAAVAARLPTAVALPALRRGAP